MADLLYLSGTWFSANIVSQFSFPHLYVISSHFSLELISLFISLCAECVVLHPAVEVINVGIYLSKSSPGGGEGLRQQLSWDWRDGSTPVFCPSLLLYMRISVGFPSGSALHGGQRCFSHLWRLSEFQLEDCVGRRHHIFIQKTNSD